MKLPVLLPKIFDHPFTYASKKVGLLKPGDIVIVPFGKKKEVGVVWDEIQIVSKNFKIKNIEKKIDNFSIDKKLIKFINWFSKYNLTPKGMVLKMCLGNNENILKIDKKKKIQNNNKAIKYFLNAEQKKSLNNLRKFGENFNVSVLQGITGSGKTLVYFERIKEIIDKNKQALVLLPEIFLTN